MIVKEVTATCRRLIALPRYENVLYECSMTAEVQPNEDPKRAYDELLLMCKAKIGKELERFEDLAPVQKETKKRIS
jgi:hypothetical protein